MDFLHLDFPPESFDAVYALNCLLHVPNGDLPDILEVIRAVLRPGGWFFLGLYDGGGGEEEEVAAGDHHVSLSPHMSRKLPDRQHLSALVTAPPCG